MSLYNATQIQSLWHIWLIHSLLNIQRMSRYIDLFTIHHYLHSNGQKWCENNSNTRTDLIYAAQQGIQIQLALQKKKSLVSFQVSFMKFWHLCEIKSRTALRDFQIFLSTHWILCLCFLLMEHLDFLGYKQLFSRPVFTITFWLLSLVELLLLLLLLLESIKKWLK